MLYNMQGKDLNTGFYKDLDTNFAQACYLAEMNFAHDELISLLLNGNIPQKQIAALKFDYVKSCDDALVVVSNLTGCDGKIREAIAYKIFQLITQDPNSKTFFEQTSPKIFADATIDINANICRLVVDSLSLFNKSSDFIKKYVNLILNYAIQSLDELDRLVYKDKKYIKNKQLFKLYWCLETLRSFYQVADSELLLSILKRSSILSEYTIRENVAKIAILSENFLSIQDLLKNDLNYYVRQVFLNH